MAERHGATRGVRADEGWPAAELRGVTKRFGRNGEVVALDALDLAFFPGQVTALLGPNGAGKTTAVRLLLGLAWPTSGVARLFGTDPRDPAARQRRGAMLQTGKVPETLTVREHVKLFSSYYPAPRPEPETLAVAGLEQLADRRFGELSGGERQRVLFALAICGAPELLFLDEPTVGLDVETRRALWGQIRRLSSEGVGIVLTTHYLEEADALADRVVVLHRGRVLADDTPSGVKRRAAGRRVRCFTRLDERELSALPGVRSVALKQGAAELLAENADPVVRALLAADPHLSGLEVTSAGLEEAFLALTQVA
ncbi:MAG: ABC transporter ATP-binding protein [Holophagales bacterium]|nr:MAG: ABC transporter ATP-binding protein [Holophagales bacterium]